MRGIGFVTDIEGSFYFPWHVWLASVLWDIRACSSWYLVAILQCYSDLFSISELLFWLREDQRVQDSYRINNCTFLQEFSVEEAEVVVAGGAVEAVVGEGWEDRAEEDIGDSSNSSTIIHHAIHSSVNIFIWT